MDTAPDPVPEVPEDGEDGRAPRAKTGDAPYGREDLLPTSLDATSGEEGPVEASTVESGMEMEEV